MRPQSARRVLGRQSIKLFGPGGRRLFKALAMHDQRCIDREACEEQLADCGAAICGNDEPNIVRCNFKQHEPVPVQFGLHQFVLRAKLGRFMSEAA